MSGIASFWLFALAFIAVLGPLVALHEWGHYIVARLCGVKVLTYSIGFGPKLASWTSKKSGINYRLSLLPLGGYVKMLDEREGQVPKAEQHLAFNTQHPLKKIAIVVAGPIMNFIIAISLFTVLFLTPSTQLNTRIGTILPDTPAATTTISSGDKIVAIDEHKVQTWEEINYRLADRMGEDGNIIFSVDTQPATDSTHNDLKSTIETDTSSIKTVKAPISDFMQGDDLGQDSLTSLGILPWQPTIEPIIGELVTDGAAERQGMQVGDKIISINGKPVEDWLTATRIIKQNPEKLLKFKVLRDNKTITLDVMPQARKQQAGNTIGYIGAAVSPIDIAVPEDYRTLVVYSPIEAIEKSFAKTGQLASMTLSSMGKMITGKVGLDNLSGPISIAVVTKQSFDISWQQVLATAALISLSLAVLNLLPIPMLDGGHLLYYLVELVRGRPVSEQAQMIGFNIGFILLLGFMILAIGNDFSRYF